MISAFIWSGLLSSTLISSPDCRGGVRKALAVTTVAGTTASQPESIWNFARFLTIPDSIDGSVGLVLKDKDLRVYAVADPTGKHFETLQIFGFDRFPIHLATIYLDESKPRDKDAIHLHWPQHMLYAALQNQVGFVNYLRAKGIIKTTPNEHLKAIMEADVALDHTIQESADHGFGPRSWGQVFVQLAQLEQTRRLEIARSNAWKFIGKPAPEAQDDPLTVADFIGKRGMKFGGYLPGDSDILVSIESRYSGENQGTVVQLNPLLNLRTDKAFLPLAERINFEGIFKAEWLKAQGPLTFVEMDNDDTPGRTVILIYEGEAHLPKGVPFYRVDPVTGARLTDKPTLLAIPSYPGND